VLAEAILPPLINFTTSQYKQYFVYRHRSLREPYCDKTFFGNPATPAPILFLAVLIFSKQFATKFTTRNWSSEV
jgi:hypothetical protein